MFRFIEDHVIRPASAMAARKIKIDKIVPSQSKTNYRPDIDGLRAIAVLCVVAFHFGLATSGGFVGVDVFFVISGFLVGGHVYQAASERSFSYVDFYARRAKRIIPALLAVLLATFVVMAAVATPQELRDFGRDGVATVFAVSNVTLSKSVSYFRPTAVSNPLLMTWSLGVEEQFYICAPILFLLITRLRLRGRLFVLSGITLLSFAVAVVGVAYKPTPTFYLLPTRAWELAAGTLLSVFAYHARQLGVGTRTNLFLQNSLAIAGLTLVSIPVVTYNSSTPFPGLAAFPVVFGTVLLLASQRSVINRRLLGHPLLRWFGLVSYSLYLWHWPIISCARMILETEPTLTLRCSLLLLSIAMAWLSYRFIETPLRRARTGKSNVAVLGKYAVALGLCSLSVGSASLSHGYPQRWSNEMLAAEAQSLPPTDPCDAPYGTVRPNLSLECANVFKATESIAVVGDSHAAALAPGLRKLASDRGFGFAELTKSSCPFLVGVSRKVDIEPRHAVQCVAFNKTVIQTLLDSPNIKTVVIAGYWSAGLMRDGMYVSLSNDHASPEALLAKGLSSAIVTLVQAGKRVVIVRDIPYFPVAPMKRVSTCLNHIRGAVNRLGSDPAECSSETRKAVRFDADSNRAIDTASVGTRAIVVDPTSLLCNTEACRFREKNVFLYIDQQHLSPAGAVLVSTGVRTALAGAN